MTSIIMFLTIFFIVKFILKVWIYLILYLSSKRRVFIKTGIAVNSELDLIFENAKPVRWLKKKGEVEISDNNFIDLQGNIVSIEHEKSEEAIVLIHGLTGNPGISKTVRDTFEYLKKDALKDIYMPLVKYHGKGFFPFNYNPTEARKKLLKDLNDIVSFGYSKIYVFASSHAALQIINLSISGKLDPKLKLIFMSPQICNKIMSRLAIVYSFFALFSFRSIIKIMFLEKITNWMLKIDSIKNDFAYILVKNDFMVDSEKAKNIFLEQKRLRMGFYLSEYGHYIIPDSKFYDYIEFMIDKMKQF